MASVVFDEKVVIPLKIPRFILHEFEVIMSEEGFGNRVSTFTYLIKYYREKKNEEYRNAARRVDVALSRVNVRKIPSIRKQLNLD